MPFDALFLAGVAGELNQTLTNARLHKIHQPAKTELLLHFHGATGAKRLLISAAVNASRLHITEHSRENPKSPPMFCMVLRKYLAGARLLKIEQIPSERVATLFFAGFNEMGEARTLRLVCELMGRSSNVILVDSDGRIVDCMRRVDMEMSEARQVLPGLFYHLPPAPEKQNFLDFDAGKTPQIFTADMPLDRLLLHHFNGISPLLCRELAFAATRQTDILALSLSETEISALAKAIASLQNLVQGGKFSPVMLTGESGTPKDFTFLPISQYGKQMISAEFPSFSALLDEFYQGTADDVSLSQKKSHWQKVLRKQTEKLNRKLHVQESELAQTKDREALRRKGDILSAYIGQIPKGSASVTLPDFYGEEGATITLPLDPTLSPQQNAAKAYKDYARLKSAENHLSGLLEQGRAELAYQTAVADALNRADDQITVDEIATEIAALQKSPVQTGNPAANRRKNSRETPAVSLSVPLEDGFVALIGRNNRQNDRLTFQTAEKNDIWFHVKDRPGGHVLIPCRAGDPNDVVLQQAADLAALYSSAGKGSKIPVDYTRARFVKRAPGGKPGMAVYTRHKTLLGNPDNAIVK